MTKRGKAIVGPFCSKKCAANNKELRKLKEKTIKNKYGVDNISQREDIKKKKEETCLGHYGVRHPYQNDKIKEKAQKACLLKYGVDNISKLDTIKAKKEEKALEKYGVKNVFQAATIKEKAKCSCIKKYGVYNFSKSLDVLKKSFQSLVKRNIHCTPLFSEKEWLGTNIVCEYPVRCNLCGEKYNARSKSDYLSLCPHCNVSGRSFKEKELALFVSENSPYPIKTTDRKVLRGCGKNGACLELDIYIEQLHLAFEFNGNYWHKEGSKKEYGYHEYKSKCCSERGVTLIHIWENEWDTQKDKIKEYIKCLLHKTTCS